MIFMVFTESDNFNAEEIAEEAAHLERVITMMHEQIRLLENDGFELRGVDIYDDQSVEEFRTDKFRHDERLYAARLLRQSLGTPYFARMKLRQIGACDYDDTPSMIKARKLEFDTEPLDDPDIYVGAHVVFYKDRIIVYSHNSPLGNRVYDRFENGEIEYGGYRYEVIFRRKFDIRDGKLTAVFQDYSKESGGVVYDKFLAHMLEKKRGDKRLTDIIPTIQANQNAIITRPADENCVVRGCAGCGKTMILLQRLEYLSFNNKLDLKNATVIAPGKRYIEHIQPVVDDLMINAARRVTMPELYRELILSLRGIRASERKRLSDAEPVGDETLDAKSAVAVYGDDIKRKLVAALAPVKRSYYERLALYRADLARYERDAVWGQPSDKPKAPAVLVSLEKLKFLPTLGYGLTKARLYLLLTAYCYILGKPEYEGALFIDEGQDYFFNEYKLLAELTRSTVNVYGDENQQLDKKRGIGDFAKLDRLWKNAGRYSLNENYRNAREITAYVNGLLGMDVTSLGLEGGTVGKIGRAELNAAFVRERDCGDDRVAFIYSPSDEDAARALAGVPESMLYTVAQAKGMEYERVYACGRLTETEKYVAYTRALSELYICEQV